MPNAANVTIVGHATRDPETRDADNAPCKFGLAANVGWGEDKAAIFFDVIVWGKPAEWAQRDIAKGMAVTVIGRLGLDKWTGNDGQARETLTITASEVCAHVRTEQPAAAPRARPAAPPPFSRQAPAPPLPPYPAAPKPTADPGEESDEIPF